MPPDKAVVSYAPVTRERFHDKRWRQSGTYAFAAGDHVLPIVGAELGQAALFMPLAFVENAGTFRIVTVLSPAPGRNLFVAPDGRWLSPHVPMVLRSYPFRLLPHRGTENLVFCIDEASGLLVDKEVQGEAFYQPDGKLAPGLQKVLDYLTAVERNRAATDLVVAELQMAGVIRPWEIKLKAQDIEKAITGLFRVDESALAALPDETFLRLRQVSALSLAYTQMLSAGQLHVFEHLARFQQQIAPPPPSTSAMPESLDKVFGIFGEDDAVIRFD